MRQLLTLKAVINSYIIWYLLQWLRNACSDLLQMRWFLHQPKYGICISKTSKVENNPAFIRVTMIDFFVEMKWKLCHKKLIYDFFRLIEVSTGKRTENDCNNVPRALMELSTLWWMIPQSIEKNIRFISSKLVVAHF